MNQEPTKSECGTFAYHPIPTGCETTWTVGDRFVQKASYCDECDECTDSNPCAECIAMCNEYVVSAVAPHGEFYYGGGRCVRGDGIYMDSTYCFVASETGESDDRDKFNTCFYDDLLKVERLPLHMPTPWEMADLEKQGVDTDILTAEQIMALRVLHATHLYNDTEVDIGNALLDGFDPDGILFYAMGSFPDECVISLGGWDGDTYTPCKMESSK